MSGPMSEAACAHLSVRYFHRQREDQTTEGWWACTGCRVNFVPVAHLHAAERVLALLPRSSDEIGRKMHESWSQTKRAQGFHGPGEACLEGPPAMVDRCRLRTCGRFHADLIPWAELPEQQKDLNRHALDAILGPVLDALEERCHSDRC